MSMTHTITLDRRGSADYGSIQAVCTCGWRGHLSSRRETESARVAQREGDDHAKHMEGGPTRYCTNSCPHVTSGEWAAKFGGAA